MFNNLWENIMKKIIVGFLLISGLNVAQASNIVQNGDFSTGTGANWTLSGNIDEFNYFDQYQTPRPLGF
jgi:hypothetical protein